MLFGLLGDPVMFQWLMNQTLHSHHGAHLDDIVDYIQTQAEHLDQVAVNLGNGSNHKPNQISHGEDGNLIFGVYTKEWSNTVIGGQSPGLADISTPKSQNLVAPVSRIGCILLMVLLAFVSVVSQITDLKGDHPQMVQ